MSDGGVWTLGRECGTLICFQFGGESLGGGAWMEHAVFLR